MKKTTTGSGKSKQGKSKLPEGRDRHTYKTIHEFMMKEDTFKTVLV